MKKITFILLLFAVNTSFSQITKTLGNFDKVTAFDQIDVTLIHGSENKIILSGADSEKVEVVNKNGELKIRMPLTKLLDGDNISATIYYSSLEAVEANEGSRIASQEIFKSTTFNIIAKEGSEIKLTLDTEKLKLKASQGAKVYLSGTAGTQDLLVNSGAVYTAEKLVSKQITITVNAGGESRINATDLVEAKVKAGGDIRIYGHPKQINQKIIAGGTIEEAK
ncbi:head GIN domain-containing protein [Flavobacterium sp. 3HN19-14]|uniref:head GIN domain-containing protein n=1 Tax=Flavobacterium sp. 3HN19-14 TaxID=3448133 RepID=UPI003EE18D2D